MGNRLAQRQSNHDHGAAGHSGAGRAYVLLANGAHAAVLIAVTAIVTARCDA
jgi:hypothetical protein